MGKGEINLRSSGFWLSLALGYVYLHYGLLKFFPDLSPAEMIATQTAMAATLQWLNAAQTQMIVAVLEVVIGLGFLFRVLPRVVFVLFLFHMAATFLPLVLLPEFVFKFVPFAPTLEGQYILKNVVFVAAAWTVLAPECFPHWRRNEDQGAPLSMRPQE